MSNVDLSALRIDESSAAVPKRPLGPRLLVAGVIALTLAVAGTFLWPLLAPPRAVRTAAIHAVADQGKGGARAATATTEAVGWVEADPFPHVVRPLVSGHIETLEVLEGAHVKAGETVVARLASAALQAAHERAVAAVGEAEAAATRAGADLQLAEERLQQNGQNALRVADARTRVAAATTKASAAEADLQQARAKAAAAAATATAQERLAEAGESHPVALERARADAAAADAAVASKQRMLDGLNVELRELRAALELSDSLAKDPVDLRGAVAQAAADVLQAEARLEKARAELRIAERERDWAVVRSPVDGVVLRLEAEPGDMVGHGATGVVTLYDPDKLRARIDVPIDSLAGIFEGQEVEVTSEAIGDAVVRGVVQRLQHETDMLKNTLQVKIGLIDPPALLRPETLCRARFLAGTDEDAEGSTRAISAFRVPRESVRGGQVFVYDPSTRRARAVAVEVTGEQGQDAVVRGALSPTQRVVLDPVADGEAVTEAQR